MDAIALLSSDHRKIRLLFGEYRIADTDRGRRMAADTLIRELSRHLAAEESVFYPYAAKVLDAKATERPLEICSAIKRDLAVLAGQRSTKEDAATSMEQLELDVADHIDLDEQYLMPRLRTASDDAELRRTGARLAQADLAGPARPHPAAPDRAPSPTVRTVITPLLALHDRIRGRVRGRPTT